MSLTNRDKQIIKALNKFKVIDRDSIAELFFANLKNPIYSANNVLLRLLRDGQIQRTTSTVPYCYYGADLQIKKNSAKINHWLAILNVYKEMRNMGEVESFLVEPKYGVKGTVEIDAYAYFRKTGFFIECQRSIYSIKQIEAKMDRYVELFNSGVVAKPFPHVLIISDHRYPLDGEYPFRVFQAESFTQFDESLKQRQPAPVKDVSRPEGVKIRIG